MNESSQLREAVCAAYSAAADHPNKRHAFPVGRQFAESLGYNAEMLDSLPAISVESFAGVSNVSLTAHIAIGSNVLDLGCGAGLDSLIAALRVGAAGSVLGVDFSAAMLDRARRATREAGMPNAQFVLADAERIPLPNASIDVVLVNGIFNLNPFRDEIFRELSRVVRVGGFVFGAELILKEALPQAVRNDPASWFA